MTTNASHLAPPADSAQQRVSQNIVQLLALRGQSRAALARHLGLDAAGVSRRTLGGTTWNLEEVQSTAAFLGVRWEWLALPLPELIEKVTRGTPGPGSATTQYVDTRSQPWGFRRSARSVTTPAALPAGPALVPSAA